MEHFLNKLSSYNFFNYLLPGVLFATLAEVYTSYSFTHPNLVITVFAYYFIGMVISRFGSLVFEPIMKTINFVSFVEHEAFVKAVSRNPRLEILFESSNTYRTVASAFVLLLLAKLYEVLNLYFSLSGNLTTLLTALLIMFLFSYRKQTAYINRTIKAIND